MSSSNYKEMDQQWFEVPDLSRRDFSKSIWIPLRQSRYLRKEGESSNVGYIEEFHGTGSVAVPLSAMGDAEKLGWMDVGISSNHSGYVDEEDYMPSDVFRLYSGNGEGVNLVLDQLIEDDGPSVWHLHQDIVVTLRLRRIGDTWICPLDGYAEVARLKSDEDGHPNLLEVKAEYLKDYLCARGMALYLTSFYARRVIVEDASLISWKQDYNEECSDSQRWVGSVTAIHEGNGSRFGEKCAVIHASRTDVHPEDDIPDLSATPSDENITGHSYETGFIGRKVFRISGELWRNDVVSPAKASTRVRRDEEPNPPAFVIDTDGNTISGSAMRDSGKWLWFKPDVIQALLSYQGGELNFYTRYTGGISCCHSQSIHFGLNKLGLINVFAKDIAFLNTWQQRIWAGFNLSPEGGVSSELLDSQVKAEPAKTQAPEPFIIKGLELLQTEANAALGIDILIEHDYISELTPRIHRFRASNEATLRELAKDIARLTADSFNAKEMQKVVTPPKGESSGSLKSLERLIEKQLGEAHARKLLGPLVGIYDLRLADAHLPKSDILKAYKLAGVDSTAPFVHQGEMLIRSATDSLYQIINAFKNWSASDSDT